MLTLHELPETDAKVQNAATSNRVARGAVPTSAPETLSPVSVTTPVRSGVWHQTLHSNRNLSPATGKSYEPLTPKHFSFNAPAGACPVCHGLGQKMVFDEGLVVPDAEKSLEQGAVLPWRRGGKRMVVYYKAMLRSLADHYQQSMETPYKDLPKDFQNVLLHGSGPTEIQFTFWRAGKMSKVARSFEGVIPNLERLYQESESEFTRNRLKSFMSPQFCDACKGQRLKPEILAVTLGGPVAPQPSRQTRNGEIPDKQPEALGRSGSGLSEEATNVPLRPRASRHAAIPGLSIMDVCALSVEKADVFFRDLQLSEYQEKIAHDIVKEIRARLSFLKNVGLGYLTLNRESGTLSGGEAQRIRLATQIGAGLVGVLYILDEPSIGLHQRDNDRLLRTLEGLRDLGNSVLVVEHDADTIRKADYILDLAPALVSVAASSSPPVHSLRCSPTRSPSPPNT